MAGTSELQATLEKNQRNARALVGAAGQVRVKAMLKKAQADLEKRLRSAEGLGGPGKDSFTAAQLRTTLAQVKQVARGVGAGIQRTLLSNAADATDKSVENTLQYLNDAEKAFKGLGAQPLALREAGIADKVRSGVNATVLRRLASSGEPIEGADAVAHPAKVGILDRYGMNTVQHFEGVLQQALLTRKPWAQVREELTAKSPFLQGAPGYWAERIVRTETMGIYNRAGWESIREAHQELGDMVKILAAVFDDRTGSDSYAVHGQIRKPDQAFESWFGLYQHPPNRPNDRETVVPHRLSWPIPPYLGWKTPGQILTRWKFEGRKGSPPARPNMTTVPLNQFGKDAHEKDEKQQAQVPEQLQPPELPPAPQPLPFNQLPERKLAQNQEGYGDLDEKQMRERLEAMGKTVSAPQRAAVRDFTGFEYGNIRRAQRMSAEAFDAEAGKGEHASYIEKAKHLDALHTPEHMMPGKVYRGIDGLPPGVYNQLLQQEDITFQGTSSTSRKPEAALKFATGNNAVMFEIKQRTAVPVEHLSSMSFEREFLVKDGTTFRVVGRHRSPNGILILELVEK